MRLRYYAPFALTGVMFASSTTCVSRCSVHRRLRTVCSPVQLLTTTTHLRAAPLPLHYAATKTHICKRLVFVLFPRSILNTHPFTAGSAIHRRNNSSSRLPLIAIQFYTDSGDTTARYPTLHNAVTLYLIVDRRIYTLVVTHNGVRN